MLGQRQSIVPGTEPLPESEAVISESGVLASPYDRSVDIDK
jgi:hypothetical protein